MDYLIRFWSIFVVTLTLNFQGQTWNLLYLSQKWSDCHETKSKHIDWIQGLKCDHGVWPWPWPWPWLFKVKYGICYISVKNGPIATKQKANILIELKALNVTMGFDLGHDLDLDFSRSNMEFAISQSKVIRRSGVRIYKIMTGVTFDVGVPSTHLVQFVFILTPLTRGSSPLCLIRGFKRSREQPDFPSTHW